MAFDKTPAQSTYQTKDVQLIREINSRGTNTSKDEDYENLYFEVVINKTSGQKDYYVVKRPGTTQLIAPKAETNVRGMYYWEEQQTLYYVVSDDLYVYNIATSTLTTTINSFFSTTTGEVGFTEYQYETGVIVLIITDGTTLKSIDASNTVVTCADADLPVPHLPTPIYLDGYLFLVKEGTADIYNSDLDDPMSWAPGNLITAEMAADKVYRLTKLSNYLIAFGTNSIEYFWDAGNDTGSPLQRNDTPFKLTGYLNGIAQIGNRVYFVGNSNESEPDVFMIEDFKIQAIGTQTLRRYLAAQTAEYTSYTGSIVSSNGHDFYVLNAGNATYALELESMLWSKWKYQGNSTFPITNVVNSKTSSRYASLFSVSGNSGIYKFDPNVYQDSGVNYNVVIITDSIDFDTYHRKSMGRLTVWCDRPTTTAPILIQWTDDDYQTYNTGLTTDMNQDLVCVRRLGYFRRRAFKITQSANNSLRIKMLEAEINMGQA